MNGLFEAHTGSRVASVAFAWVMAAWLAAPAVAQLVPGSQERRRDDVVDQQEILEEYLFWQNRKEAIARQIKERFAKPFPEFTREDYSSFMNSLDLSRDADLWKWSSVTDIPILAVSRKSGFFYRNRHLLENTAEADAEDLSIAETLYERKTNELSVLAENGRKLSIRSIPEGTIRLMERTNGFMHLQDFGEDRIVFEVLQPYLVRLRDLEYRAEIGDWIRRLPLSVVKVYRGKGIYFTTQIGRSYAVAMPVSNSIYEVFAGLQTGVFVDPRRDGLAGTEKNLVHELGHLVDYTVIKGGYGSYRQTHQFPEFRKAQPEKELVFGTRDDKVPQTPYGYISRYAKINAQESFADHFRAYILERQEFLDRARKEESEGHPELMEKFRFMEKLFTTTSQEMVRLSPEFLAWEKTWQEGYEELSGLYQRRKNLGDGAPDSLSRLIDDSLAGAYTGR